MVQIHALNPTSGLYHFSANPSIASTLTEPYPELLRQSPNGLPIDPPHCFLYKKSDSHF